MTPRDEALERWRDLGLVLAAREPGLLESTLALLESVLVIAADRRESEIPGDPS